MTNKISTTIDPSLYKALRQARNEQGQSITYLINTAIRQFFLDKNIHIRNNSSPSSPRRPSARVRAAKAEAPKASPAPASRYPAGLEEGVRALCREVWKKGGPFQLDGQTCELYSTAVGWLLEHAAETMERRNLDVEGYLAFRRSQMLAGGEAGL